MGIIAGIYSAEQAPGLADILTSMLKSQSHRDQSMHVSLVDAHTAIGMANKHDTIFCNGAEKNRSESPATSDQKSGIYAFVDGIVLDVPKHRQYLESIGFPVPVPTCSAIVAAAYEKWGLDFMDHLEGEFSCAVWDPKKNILVLVRDPYGHKPLHYYYDGNRLLFSSEIKGILAGNVKPEIDLISLSDFLSLNCIPYPGTIFKNIYQVPPGSMVILDHNDISTRTYWVPKMSENKILSLDDAVIQITESLKNAVKKRMVADNAYCFLSGGIDSSAIVSFASEISGKRVHAVSVGFEEEEANELKDAEIMANHVGAELHQVIASPASFFDMLDTLVFHHDSPFTDTSAYPTFFAGKLGRQFTDIILTGDGPDQTIGGSGHHVFAVKYDSFSHRSSLRQLISSLGAQLSGILAKDPSPTLMAKVRRKLYRDSRSPVHAAYDLRSYFPDIVKHFLCTEDLWEIHQNNDPYRHPESWFKEAGDVDDVNKYLYADMKFYVPDDLMIKVDRMCMAHGLETLSPFQDLELASIVNQLPGSYKINVTGNGEIITKYILKKVCEKRFPEHTLKKKKQGFGIPLERWLRQDNGRTIREILLDPGSLKRPYFKKQSMERLVEVFVKNEGDYFFPGPSTVAGLLTLELWHQRYLG